MKRLIIIALALICSHIAFGQYAPQAGVTGTTAIPANSSLFTGWATGCSIKRGYLDIASPTAGYTSSGDSTMALGPVDNFVVSLGDSGIAVLSFPGTIYNGPGPDFAVFENGFSNPVDPEQAFLELAFVEVSSDGINYYRFSAASETPVDTQIAGAGIYMDARKIDNLAGKYVSNYGTPFDLDELAGTPGLDVDHIVSIRLVDVIGTTSSQASYDHSGKKINDPYPTPYPTGGFDLDAVGLIHQQTTGIASQRSNITCRIYPNPTSDKISVETAASVTGDCKLVITDMTGALVYSTRFEGKTEIALGGFPSGIYCLRLEDMKGNKWVEKITKL